MKPDDDDTANEAAYAQVDLEAEILANLAKQLGGLKGITKLGPIGPEGECPIGFETEKDRDDAKLPGSLNVFAKGADRALKLIGVITPPSVPLTGPGTAPIPPSGPLTGGDAIWVTATPNDFGTLAFAANSLRVSDAPASAANPVPAVPNAQLSCNHVLANGGAVPPASISTVSFPGAFNLFQSLPVNTLDAAIAVSVNSATSIATGRIRGLGRLTGVERPFTGMRVYKYGARTGLTTGIVGSVLGLTVAPGVIFNVFQIANGFACVHDSGAAVVNRQRRFVGLVFRGSSATCSAALTTYILPAQDINGPATPSINSIFVAFT